MSVFGSCWETWYFVVCKQICACNNEMDKILSQTLGAFHPSHSSYKWIAAILLCGKDSTTLQIRIVSGLWVCRRLWRLKVNIRWNSLHFRKQNICANKLDVQETDLSFTLFNGCWSNFSRCRFTYGRYSRTHSLGFGDWSIHSVPNRRDGPNREPQGNPSAVAKPNMHISISIKHTKVIPTNIHHIPSNTTHSGPGAML